LQIHSLTARSVPRHFREGLKQSMPTSHDRNIKIPTTTTDPLTDDDPSTAPPSARRHPADLHIIYDSRDQVPRFLKFQIRRSHL
jgi:hypothetical protein